MAYINQETKKELSVNIKKVLKKYNTKGTISVDNHSTLIVTIQSSTLDIIGNWFQKATLYGTKNSYGDIMDKPEYMNVNEYWIDEHYTGEVKDFLNELLQAMKGDNWFDKSDIQSDCFHIAWYCNIHVGKWNKPFQLV